MCAGALIRKEYGRGYGGYAIQRCKINNEDVTVVYGHLRLDSITPALNDVLKLGQQIAVLGKGYSVETDGERKHLHLGIHKGQGIDSRGYVQSAQELSQWIDAMTLLE